MHASLPCRCVTNPEFEHCPEHARSVRLGEYERVRLRCAAEWRELVCGGEAEHLEVLGALGVGEVHAREPVQHAALPHHSLRRGFRRRGNVRTALATFALLVWLLHADSAHHCSTWAKPTQHNTHTRTTVSHTQRQRCVSHVARSAHPCWPFFSSVRRRRRLLAVLQPECVPRGKHAGEQVARCGVSADRGRSPRRGVAGVSLLPPLAWLRASTWQRRLQGRAWARRPPQR